MPQIGSEAKPVTFRKTIAGRGSRFRKGMNLSQYKDNYDRIFNKGEDTTEYATEFESARETITFLFISNLIIKFKNL